MTDIQAALGRSQLKKAPRFQKERAKIAEDYSNQLSGLSLELPKLTAGAKSAWHLYPVCVQGDENLRNKVMSTLRRSGVMANLHYLPVSKFQFYKKQNGTTYLPCPQAEKHARTEISLPMFPGLEKKDIYKVVASLKKSLR